MNRSGGLALAMRKRTELKAYSTKIHPLWPSLVPSLCPEIDWVLENVLRVSILWRFLLPVPFLSPEVDPALKSNLMHFNLCMDVLCMIPFKPWKAFRCILCNDVFPAPHLIWTPFHALKLTASWIACRLFLCCVLTSSPHWPASYLGPRKNNTIYY